ncbi:unnamed protein product, partial [Meganyctiphanes norvegica]
YTSLPAETGFDSVLYCLRYQLTMLIKLFLSLALLNLLIGSGQCLEDNTSEPEYSSAVRGVIHEFVTVLHSMQSDTSENIKSIHIATSEYLRNMQSATSVNIQTVMSALSLQSANTDANSVSIIDTVDKNNQILQNHSELLSSQSELLSSQSNEISSLKETLENINNVLAEIKNNTAYIKPNMEANNETTVMLDSDIESNIDISHKAVPSGFTSYNDRIVLLPTALGGTMLTWSDSVIRCLHHGAVPFIPKNVDDFKYIQQVNSDIGSGAGIWLPASDQGEEGVTKWTDGTDASTTLKLFDWMSSNGYTANNAEDQDCVNVWTASDNKLEYDPCTRNNLWPMICEII